ncbi:MAG: hypothetical protein JW903_01415 [Clostridia bacterium]|nr:hypothetical protein [Clostridia bacterium]
MRKTIYIVLAVLLAAGLTVIQAVIAKSASRSNETIVYVAADDYKKGTVLEDSHLNELVIYTKNADIHTSVESKQDLIGMTLSGDIVKDEIITSAIIYDSKLQAEDERYVALKVDGSNFNAGFLTAGDIVDIFFLPDFEKLENYQIVWLNENLVGYSRFIKGKTPGILINDLRINHISKTAGDQAEYVSVCVPGEVDEVIAFLEQISEYEFIGH